MNVLIVVSDPKDWNLDVPDVEIVSADAYLTDPRHAAVTRRKVLNLCSSLRYQRSGYYVSLLAEARGQRPLPTIGTVQDLKSTTMVRMVSHELEELIQKALKPLASETFELSVYFGHNLAKRYDALAQALFRRYQAPLLRAEFRKRPRKGTWEMHNIEVVDLAEVPEDHRDFVVGALAEFVSGKSPRVRRRPAARYDMAILRDPGDPEPASDAKAIKRFVKAGEAVGFAVEVIEKDAYARTAEFDALFLRDTTGVNHYTYRFARKAKAQGLVVLDDPESILRCMNKVYLAELLQAHDVPAPKTMVVTRRNARQIEREMGLPCVLKQPDSAFSAGVVKVDNREELRTELDRLFAKSSLLIAQEFRPTDFDWRIGVLDGQPLYACRYYMARRHWQIIEREGSKKYEGTYDTLPVEQVPTPVIEAATRSASLYGDGLYGVDLKQDSSGIYVIEVNDNPSLDGGVEDAVLGDELYLRIMRWFMARVEQRKSAGRLA